MTYSSAANNAGKKRREHDILGTVRGTKDQPTDRGIHALTRDFSTLTREKCHGSSRPDPHKTRISRVTRSVAGWVGSGQEHFKHRGSGRVGSEGFQNLAGRVGSGQEVFKISRVGSSRVKTFRNSHESDRVRPDPNREIDPTREKP